MPNVPATLVRARIAEGDVEIPGDFRNETSPKSSHA